MGVVLPVRIMDAGMPDVFSVPGGNRMNVHKGARTTPWSRALIVMRVREEGQSVTHVAADFGISETTVRK